MERRVATLCVVLVVLLAGCSSLFGETTFPAGEATVSEAALSETGYETVTVSTQTVTRSVGAGEASRSVTVEINTAVYRRGPGDERPTTLPVGFVLVSAPGVEVGNDTVNPLSDVPVGEVVDDTDLGYANVSIDDAVGTRDVTVLGSERRVTRFDGSATENGSSVNVTVHVTTVEHEGEFLLAVAVYPSRLPERQRVDRLLAGVRHSAE